MTGDGGGGDGDDDDHDLGGDDDALRGMRSVWLSMRDEEPSGRGMAELMAAARAQAASKQPEPAWKRAWAAITDVLRRPPVLALATIVVVAGTAALVTSHGGLTTSEPRAAQAVQAPSPVVPASATAAPGDEGRAGGRSATDQGMATDKKESVAPVAQDAPVAAAPVVPALESVAAPKPVTHAPMKKAPAKPNPPGGSRAPSTSTDGRFGATLDDDDAAEAQTTKLARPPDKAPMAPPPADPAAPSDAAPVAQGASHGRSETGLVQQLRACQAAAARGDCPAVRTMAERLRARDAAFYRATVAKDAAISKCLASP